MGPPTQHPLGYPGMHGGNFNFGRPNLNHSVDSMSRHGGAPTNLQHQFSNMSEAGKNDSNAEHYPAADSQSGRP